MFTVTPVSTMVLAQISVVISRAALDEPYGTLPGRFIVSSLVVTLTMRPQPCLSISGATRRPIWSAAT